MMVGTHFQTTFQRYYAYSETIAVKDMTTMMKTVYFGKYGTSNTRDWLLKNVMILKMIPTVYRLPGTNGNRG